ncbi:unnamed protein product [Victoria cruziana]
MGIFEPFRAIGYITAGVPFSVQRLGSETFVTVSIGKAWQTYNCSKLTLVFVGPQMPKRIRALATYRDFTFAAVGRDIAVFKRAHQVATWSRHDEKVNLLLLFGDHIYSVDVKGKMFIWAFKGVDENLAPIGSISLDDGYGPSCIMHPDTYVNKVIVGSQKGMLQLWNISTKKKLHEFKGWGSPVECCVSSPALDVVGVGCANGKIHVHNLRIDEEVVAFTHSSRGAVTALSFCTDGQPLLASGGSSGIISIWNLEKRRLQSVIQDAHDGAITSLHFLAKEPVLMSSAADNSIKMWIFDTSDGEGRLLRFRSGHSAPPLCIRFYKNGRHILSAGQDRAFRLFSTIQDQQCKELSQRHVSRRAKKLKVKEEEIKLKPVISFDCAEIRERDWCNVVTCHMDTPCAYVWRLQNFVLGEHILSPCPHRPSPVKACAISVCGNFAILGTEGGWIERFNLQSGLSRGSYVDTSVSNGCAHEGAVVSIACDSTNSHLISAGYAGDIKVWDFKGRELKSRWEIGCSVFKFVYHRGNGILATAADDMVISEDGKWLLSASMDGSLRIWDVILARQIDAMHVDVPITALSLSPNMDILATSHADHNGIYLWVNQMMFSGSCNMHFHGSGKEIPSVQMPGATSKGIEDEEIPDMDNKELATNKEPSIYLLKQIPDLITLSLLPKIQWQSLVNLDIIKVRNKPVEPPKKPEKAPFFLPTVPSLSGEVSFKSNAFAAVEENMISERSQLVHEKHKPALSSQFLQFLDSCSETMTFEPLTEYLKSLSPSALDLELRILQITDEDLENNDHEAEIRSIELILNYFIHELSCRNNFEFIQALVRLFLMIHGETIRCQPTLSDKAKKLLEVQSSVWQRLDRMFQGARCMVTFLSNSQL